MRAVIQRVSGGKVTVASQVVGEIGQGLVVLLGVGDGDTVKDAAYIADKTVNLRIFEDEDGKFNFSALDLGLEILAISQFTLYGDCRKGRRPSFTQAAAPENAKELYEKYVEILKNYGLKVETGIFQADMQVEIVNAGPVTMLLDSKREF